MSFALALVVCTSAAASADEPAGTTTIVTRPGTLTPAPAPAPAKPAAAAPLVGLDSGSLALVPPGSAIAARDDGLAGSPSTGIDLSYIPPAERDSYLNSHDFADHLQTSTRKGRHPSALSQIGGVAEGMAINGAIMGLSGLTLGAQ